MASIISSVACFFMMVIVETENKAIAVSQFTFNAVTEFTILAKSTAVILTIDFVDHVHTSAHLHLAPTPTFTVADIDLGTPPIPTRTSAPVNEQRKSGATAMSGLSILLLLSLAGSVGL